ncbi:vesicle transport protein [Dichotomocladium elegans]|nr:vesicle transport protein [Dichotomocladium elegans]
MVTSLNEIKTYRLLHECEQLFSDVGGLTEVEKSKYASKINTNTAYSSRIDQLANQAALLPLDTRVNKGVSEARLTKKLLLEGLKRIQQPDEPEWLQHLRAMPDEGSSAIHETDKDRVQEASKVQESAAMDEASSDQLRRRRRSTTREETTNIEHVLQHHRQMHDELTTDLSRMAQQLKLNSQSFGETLRQDDKILENAQAAIATNLNRLRHERERLDKHYSKSWGTSFMTMGVVLFVCITFFLVFFTIKFLPKA